MSGATLTCQVVQSSPKVIALRFTGEVDETVSRRLESEFDSALQAQQPRHVLLDLSGLTFASTAFYSCLLFWKEDVNKKGGHLFLVALPPSIHSTMRIFTLDRKFQIYPDQAAALAALAAG
jgi:anti-anti-sigma factor